MELGPLQAVQGAQRGQRGTEQIVACGWDAGGEGEIGKETAVGSGAPKG